MYPSISAPYLPSFFPLDDPYFVVFIFSVNVYILFVVNIVFCSSFLVRMFTVKNAREPDSHSGSMFAGLDKSCKMLGFELFRCERDYIYRILRRFL